MENALKVGVGSRLRCGLQVLQGVKVQNKRLPVRTALLFRIESAYRFRRPSARSLTRSGMSIMRIIMDMAISRAAISRAVIVE
jgi:hypothetical protein